MFKEKVKETSPDSTMDQRQCVLGPTCLMAPIMPGDG